MLLALALLDLCRLGWLLKLRALCLCLLLLLLLLSLQVRSPESLWCSNKLSLQACLHQKL